MLGIYNRLPQSLKEEVVLEDGAVLSGLEPSVSEDSTVLTISASELYWSELGVVNFPEVSLDARVLSLLPGDYIVGVGYTPLPDTNTVLVSDVLATEYLVSLKGIYLDLSFRVENLYEDDETLVFKPGYPNSTLTVVAEGLSSLKLQTEYEVVYNSSSFFPSEGFVTIPIPENATSVELLFPDELTEVKNLYVSGELSFRDNRSLGKRGEVSLFLQPVGRELLEDIPDSRINIGLVNFGRSGSVRVLRKFEYAQPNFDITKMLTEFWDNQLSGVYQTLFFYLLDYLNPFTAYKKEYE